MSPEAKEKVAVRFVQALGVAIIVGSILAFFAIPMYTYPKYKVWKKDKDGKAALAQAKNERKVQIEDAKGRLEAERLNAQAEVARAKGAAEAISIENGELTENYIRYLWVRNLEDTESREVVYVPTEAGLPILEAGNR